MLKYGPMIRLRRLPRLLVLPVLLGGLMASADARVGATSRPNIVVILTDDQRWDTLWAMPTVKAEIAAHGMTFGNAMVTNSLCCPSRAGIMTGAYSHTTGVYSNEGVHGGFASFDDSSTIATALHDVGYRTGLLGKYLNGYTDGEASYIPPGWDRWFAFLTRNGDGEYFDYSVSDQGAIASYGTAEADYSTDVLADQADTFIRSTDPSQPLFLYLSTRAPHEPAVPAPRDAGAFATLRLWRPPSYNERDVSDKPAYIQNTKRWRPQKSRREDTGRLDQYRTLLAVDDAVGTVVDALTETGRLSNTVIVFASDNGYLWGEHRWSVKMVPYEESIRVPMVIRYDPLTPSPSVDDHLVLNIDLAPTFAEVAATSLAGSDGQSLVPLLEEVGTGWRTDFLVEHLQTWDDVPSYCAVRNEGHVYVGYGTEEQELYDLAADPYQLTNVAADPGYEQTVVEMKARLEELCQPPPPGYVPP
jgi:N-acetylglucosamine-6-sulfatase